MTVQQLIDFLQEIPDKNTTLVLDWSEQMESFTEGRMLLGTFENKGVPYSFREYFYRTGESGPGTIKAVYAIH